MQVLFFYYNFLRTLTFGVETWASRYYNRDCIVTKLCGVCVVCVQEYHDVTRMSQASTKHKDSSTPATAASFPLASLLSRWHLLADLLLKVFYTPQLIHHTLHAPPRRATLVSSGAVCRLTSIFAYVSAIAFSVFADLLQKKLCSSKHQLETDFPRICLEAQSTCLVFRSVF